MKIIQVVPSIGEESAGPSYSVPALAKGICLNDVDVELHFLDDVPAHVKNGPYKVVNYPRHDSINLGWSPEMYRGLKKACQTADIIHNNSIWMLPNVYPYWASKGTRCKLVVAPRGAFAPWAMKKSWFKKKLFGWMFQNAALQNADMFHATSEKEYEEIRALGYRQPIAIVPIGMDIPQGNGSVDKKDQKRIRRIVFFGRIHEVKAVDNLVHAWGDLYQLLPQWELVIAGPDCGAKETLERIINDRQIPRVRFIGELNGHAKYDFLSDADIYVLPSHTENFGVTVAEALASGVPVIASQGTPWEGLEKEHCGRWIPIGVEPLKIALKELTALSDEKRQEMGKFGRDWIVRDFSWTGIGAKMKEAYAWLLGEGDKPNCVRLD